MTIDCGSCGARYNIQDSLIPPQGARVKCKKCATMMTIPPPPLAELAPQDLELIPPAPEPEPAPPAYASSVRWRAQRDVRLRIRELARARGR